MKKLEAFNTFSDGMVLDLNPLQMSNTSLSNCLNGTLLTFNGDENVLLNDMGNARVETAMLPAGYVPLGTASFGGIIYIVSLNPITKDYQIGSFPSPERNLMKDELGDDSSTYIDLDDFCSKGLFGDQTSSITSYYLKVNLTKFNIHAGDKFKVFSNDLNYSQISAWDANNVTFDPDAYPKYVKLDVVSTLDDGKTVSLTDDLNWTGSGNPFYIYSGNIGMTSKNELTLKEYRDLIKANYDVYLGKMAGKLGVSATLEVPNSFSVGYDVLTNPSTEENVVDIQLYFYLNWSNNKVGDFKSVNNPAGVFVEISNMKATYPIKLLTNDRMFIIPDNKLGKKYLTIIPPDNYTDNDWNIRDYLLRGQNKFGTVLRKNDGSDFQYLLVGPKIKYNKRTKVWLSCDTSVCYQLPSDILTVSVTPIMPFGRLDYLKRTLSIDLSKLQTDQINLNSYQYYVSDDNVNMNFNIEYYPSLGNTIKKVDIELYLFNDNVDVQLTINGRPIRIWQTLKTYDDEDINNYTTLGECVKTLTINGNANGYLKITFDKNNLTKDRIYIVKFIINCTNGNRVFHRLFFNSSIFNAEYSSEYDFKDLKLYSPDQKGGIKPEFSIRSAAKINEYTNIRMNNGLIIPNENNFQYYKTEETLDKINHLYEITHGVNGYYNIESGLGEELRLEISGVSKNDVNVEYVSDCNLLDALSKPSIFTLGSKLELENTFVIEVPYTVDYSDAENLDIYDFKALTKDPTKIRLSHWSAEQNEGYFTMWANREWDNNNYRALFTCPDESVDIDFYTSDEFENVLLNILNKNNSDYITAVFGIEGFGDTNIGYAFNIMLNDTSYTLYYKLNNPNNHYHIVNIVRKSDGTAAIIHLASGLLFNDSLNDAIVKNYDDIIKRSDTKDLQVIKNTYKKYSKTGKSKTVFYIKDINNNDKTLSVTANYKANVNILISSVMLINGSTVSTLEGGVTNFTMDNIENIEVNLPLVTAIDNTKLIHDALSRNSTMTGWYNDEIIDQNALGKVYDENGFVVPNMSIREQDLLLVYNDSNLDKVRWYFGWENIGSTDGGPITKDQFNLTKQRYSVNYTYRIK